MKDEEVIFYTTHCPKCRALELLLKKYNIKYVENENVEEMLSLGLESAPAIKVGDKILDFSQAAAWVRGQ